MIAIDAGNRFDQPPTGVAVYARNLTRALADTYPETHFGWYFRSNRFLRSFRSRMPANVSRHLLESPFTGWTIRRARLFHGLNQRLPEDLRAPAVATFHDLFVLTGEYSNREFRARFSDLARETAERSSHIIAVSSHTASQVEEHLGVPRSQISVVHHGSEPQEPPAEDVRNVILRRLGVQRPFLLHVGALQVRKNLIRLVDAFERIPSEYSLVLAGPLGYRAQEILDHVEHSKARDRIHLPGHVSDDVRAALYNDAEVLVFPSLEEGFGLPVVEAFGAGLPVVASNVSAIPEVTGDAAVLVDPHSPDAIAQAVVSVLDDSDLRESLRARGLARAARFTWRRCAEGTWEVYQRLIKERA